mmetsp:Transcript_24466/g.73004  ORF Transcript_24466/g.73004 Transcript_24466/m.73004 type:complete len:244 (+) Transcript_24466:347-1078(+)
MLRPSGEKSTQLTSRSCPRRTPSQAPEVASHSMDKRSAEAVAMRLLSGEKQTQETSPVCPLMAISHSPKLPALQTRTVRSPEEVAMCCPSGEKAAQRTALLWPRSVSRQPPVATVQSLAVRSAEPVTMEPPSGEKAAERTASLWPTNQLQNSPVAASHVTVLPSEEAVSSSWRRERTTSTRSPWNCSESRSSTPLCVSQRLSSSGVPAAALTRLRSSDTVGSLGTSTSATTCPVSAFLAVTRR